MIVVINIFYDDYCTLMLLVENTSFYVCLVKSKTNSSDLRYVITDFKLCPYFAIKNINKITFL